MLYVTTRNEQDTCTAFKALHTPKAADGGLYIPFRLEKLDADDLRRLGQNGFARNVAQILNYFFSASVTAEAVDQALGEAPVALVPLGSRVAAAECWHNEGRCLSHLVSALLRLLSAEEADVPGAWGQIAGTVALLFGIFGELLSRDARILEEPLDLAVTTGDFTVPMAAWYGRKMGLPIANILCGCNRNGAAWELLYHGSMDTGASVMKTTTPDCDFAVPGNLERLVACTIGQREVHRFLQCCRDRGEYSLEPELLQRLRRGLRAAVISDDRVATLLPSVYRTNGYLLSPYTALAYGCLMDHRANTQENRNALLLADRSPALDAPLVARYTELPVEAVE